jgi:hypothetical protein
MMNIEVENAEESQYGIASSQGLLAMTRSFFPIANDIRFIELV